MTRLLYILLFLLISCAFADDKLEGLQRKLSNKDLHEADKADLLYQLGARQSELGMGQKAVVTFTKVLTEHPEESGAVLATIRRLVLAKDVMETGEFTPYDLKVRRVWRLLERTIVPRIEFNKTPIRDVFQKLREVSKELDPDGVGINFLTILGYRKFLTSADIDFVSGDEEDFFADTDIKAADQFGDEANGGESAQEGVVDTTKSRQRKALDAWERLLLLEPEPITHTFENVGLLTIVESLCGYCNLEMKVEPYAVVIFGPGSRGWGQGKGGLCFHPVPRLLLEKVIGAEGNSEDYDALNFQAFFESRGVTFPFLVGGDRATMSYDRGTNKIISWNTFRNEALIKRILNSGYQPTPILAISLQHVELNNAFVPGKAVKSLEIAGQIARLQLMGEIDAALAGSSITTNGGGMKVKMKVTSAENERPFKVALDWEAGTPATAMQQTTFSLCQEIPLALPVPGKPMEALIVDLLVVDQLEDLGEIH